MDLDADAERAAMLLREAKQQRPQENCDVRAQTRNTGPRASGGPALRFIEGPVAGSDTALLLPPKLSRAAPPNHAVRATIAFLESDCPDATRAGDAYGDIAEAIERRAALSRFFPRERAGRRSRTLLQAAGSGRSNRGDRWRSV